MTDYGRRLLFDEVGVTHVDFANLCPTITSADAARRLIIHPNKDVGVHRFRQFPARRHGRHALLVERGVPRPAAATTARGAAMVTLKERRG